MNILIIGCGKVGSRLALELDRQGHDVFIIDKEEKNFELLNDSFSGFTAAGVPIDQDFLIKAGIKSCDAVAAVTQDDNVNIMVSQLAREIFEVPIVITRIYDPKRKDVFSHFGLHTICPTNLTVAAVCAALTNTESIKYLSFGTSTVTFLTKSIDEKYIGKHTDEIKDNFDMELFAVLHADSSMTLTAKQDIILQPQDKFVFSNLAD